MRFLTRPILPSWLNLRRFRDGKARAGNVQASIANIDDNATVTAATDQSAEDAAARRAGSPAEQGGQG